MGEKTCHDPSQSCRDVKGPKLVKLFLWLPYWEAGPQSYPRIEHRWSLPLKEELWLSISSLNCPLLHQHSNIKPSSKVNASVSGGSQNLRRPGAPASPLAPAPRSGGPWVDALAARLSLVRAEVGGASATRAREAEGGDTLARLSVVREQRPLWSADELLSSPGSEAAMAESPTEEAATATAGAGAAGPGASGVAGVVGVSGSGGGFGPPFLPDVWAAAAAAGGAGGPGSGLAPLPGLPPSAAAHGAALLSHWDPTLSSDWDGERTAPQCLLRIKR